MMDDHTKQASKQLSMQASKQTPTYYYLDVRVLLEGAQRRVARRDGHVARELDALDALGSEPPEDEVEHVDELGEDNGLGRGVPRLVVIVGRRLESISYSGGVSA